MKRSVLGGHENIVGKEQNAGYQHFLPFPQCFQKPSFSKPFLKKYVLGGHENIVRKEQNAGYQHFLPFPQCFQKPSFSEPLNLRL